MKIEIVKYDYSFLMYSSSWLADEEIRTLTNTPVFTKETQLSWFNNLENMTDYFIWGISADGKPIGACGLKKVTKLDCEYWGYIGEKEYWGQGIGKEIMDLLIAQAKIMQLKSVWLQVINDNERAIKLYANKGFEIEKEEGSIILMRKHI